MISSVRAPTLVDKTRRGQRGRVEAGKSGGGNAYGYDVVEKLDSRGDPSLPYAFQAPPQIPSTWIPFSASHDLRHRQSGRCCSTLIQKAAEWSG